MERYELHVHGADKRVEVIPIEVPNLTSARSRAGRKAKYSKRPVDLARAPTAEDDPFDERYVTTANPSDIHSAGYSFEKLVG